MGVVVVGLSRKEGNMFVVEVVIGRRGALLEGEDGREIAGEDGRAKVRLRGVSSKWVRDALREGLGSWGAVLGLEV